MTESNFEADLDRDYADVDPEAPEADVLEQRTSTHADAGRSGRAGAPFEADAADAAEQDLDVGVDEDEYRDA